MLNAEQRKALEGFAHMIEESPHNLVSSRAREELRTRHIPECVALAGMLPQQARRLVDVGSGGGLPGIAIAIANPVLEVHLVESTKKKAQFLTSVANDLGLNVHVHAERAESLAQTDLREQGDVVTARAVAPLQRLIPLTHPFVRVGGLLYAVKGKRWASELHEAGPQLKKFRMTVVSTPDEARPKGPTEPMVVVLARTQ